MDFEDRGRVRRSGIYSLTHNRFHANDGIGIDRCYLTARVTRCRMAYLDDDDLAEIICNRCA